MTIPAIQTLTLQDFDYELPPNLVAKYPLPQRDQSRMLLLNRAQGSMEHLEFAQFPMLLEEGDLLVLNNAKVIPARLHGHREGYEGHVELFLMHPETADRTQWQVLMRPAKRLKPGSIIVFKDSPLRATILERQDAGRGLVKLEWPATLSFDEVLNNTGTMPIPPYLERAPEEIDNTRYQTVFAKVAGAQAAPTAGLHFTPEIFQQLEARGVRQAEITLNVSAGTFRPVLSDTLEDHKMDIEHYKIPLETALAITETQAQGKRVIAVGTTVAKTLETSAMLNQGQVKAESRWSELFIKPGFQFQVADGLLTNFHLPKSTLLMLVSTFASQELIMKAYAAAVIHEYRFYSYGDCMFIT